MERYLSEYELHSWVIMPNHVHLLLTPEIEMSAILKQIKGATAKSESGTGEAFWQNDSFDRLVRNDSEFRRIELYIQNNPVRAGLANSPELYPWSSVYSASTLSSAL
ncbi:MAG TPA: transposase [Bryobacteraceae bacterium]|nr:transposase [Bryobacteraceae bacterium]